MASSLLRLALSRNPVKALRVLNFVRNSSATAHGPGPVTTYDPNINHWFYESVIEPIPDKPRTIGFEGALKALKERELGDWKTLSAEEQMDLYNMYFSMSVADMCRHNDTWKSSLGACMLALSMAMWCVYILKTYIIAKQPHTVTDPDWVKASLKKQLQLHNGHITGISSKWDYENNCWKK